MRKILYSLLFFLLLCSLLVTPQTISSADSDDGPKTAEEVIKNINEDMVNLYNKNENYYADYINKSGNKLPLRTDLILKRMNGLPDTEYKKNTYEIVYGSSHGKTLHHKGKEILEYSGYSKDGHKVPTEGVPWYSGWSGTKIQDFDLIPNPWNNDDVKEKFEIKPNEFSLYTNKNNQYLENGTFEKSIQTGMNYEYGNGKKYEEFIYEDKNKTYINKSVYNNDAKPASGGDWRKYVHVIQPPTQTSWGFGTVYIDHANKNITYLDIPLAPFNLLDTKDLSATFETLPSEAIAGEQVSVSVKVSSTFPKSITSTYNWRITQSNGTKLTPSGSGLEYGGNDGSKSDSESGKFTIANKNEEKIFTAKFTIPKSGVTIQFNVNPDGKEPKEINLKNNVLDSSPRAIQLLVPQEADYDVLSWKQEFLLKGGPEFSVQLTKPDGEWITNAIGRLNINNNTPAVYKQYFDVLKNIVDEDSESITITPEVKTIVRREDFGDDPLKKKWHPSKSATVVTKEGSLSYEGSVSRTYEYEISVPDGVDSKGVPQYKWVTRTGTVTEPFIPGQDKEVYKVNIYNGMEELPDTKNNTFKNVIKDDTGSIFKKNLYWENEHYPFDVIRYMHHLDAKKNPYGETTVPGRYKRSFTQQASANIEWKHEVNLVQQYKMARTAAKEKKNVKSQYDKAVFATDRELQKDEYPIKSGYYFNPAGSYTFDIKTVTFKETDKDTEDHQDMVDTLIDSFRYGTDLIYINNNKQAVNLKNKQLDSNGKGGFKTEFGVLKAEDRTGVNASVLLQVLDRSDTKAERYKKKVEPIINSEDKDVTQTHDFWKMMMEGYSLSDTAGSNTKYKYREYVKNGHKMYKITETTRVTIVINPDNIPLYTHANMQNGTYQIKVWIDDTELSRGNHEYQKLNKLTGIDDLDSIDIQVTGSMYDDLNN